MRVGQATLFVLLGLVLVSVFAFAIFARGLLVTDKLQEQAREMVEDFLQTNSITYYVEGCLERVSLDSMKRLAANGGNYTPGLGTLGQDYLQFSQGETSYNISYGVVPNTLCDGVYNNSPDYPLPNTALDDLVYPCQSRVSGFFGANILTKLCSFTGQNSREETDNAAYFCSTSHYSLHNYSLQGIMAKDVEQNLRECVDFSIYEDLGHNITLTEDDIHVEVIYGKDQTSFIASFPFQVDVGGRKPIISVRDFAYTAPVRFKKLYEFVNDLLKYDSIDHEFNISRDYPLVPSYDPGFELDYFVDSCDGCTTQGQFDDVIRVRDFASLIEGQALVFQSAIMNRRPALDYIHRYDGEGNFDILVIENETILLSPQSYDPDDTSVDYTYTGWRETTDSEFDFDCAEEEFNNLPEGEQFNGELNLFGNCMINYSSIDPGRQKWSDSEEYIDTLREASVNTTPIDTGLHTVRITTSSQGGLVDYQDVKILVFDTPRANASGNNTFYGLNFDQASIEDPYILDGGGSQASFIMNQLITNFEWTILDPDDVEILHQSTPIEQYLLPEQFLAQQTPPISPLVWRNMASYLPFNVVGTYNVSLIIETESTISDPDSFDLEVFQCIPYRNRTGGNDFNDIEPSAYAYPYSPSSKNNLYDHTCCLGSINDGEIQGDPSVAGDGTPCFNGVRWGSFMIFEQNSLSGSYGALPIENRDIIFDPLPPDYTQAQALAAYNDPLQGDDLANDIFQRNTTRYCGDDQGNICGGDATDVLTRLHECADFGSAEEDERCQGPSNNILRSSPYACYSYGMGDSFEHEFDLPGANGICNENWKCSENFYDDSGGDLTTYRARGLCGGGSCDRIYTGSAERSDWTEVCTDFNHDACVGYEYLSFTAMCDPNQNHQCVPLPPVAVASWTSRCEQSTSVRSRYCTGNMNEHEPGQCGETECCVANPAVPEACVDPCESYDPDCVHTGDSSSFQGRICDGGTGSCSALSVAFPCDDGAGYCNAAEGGDWCQPKMGEGETGCTHNNMCQEGLSCQGGTCLPS